VKVTEAVLTGADPSDVVATMAFGYRSAFNTGLRVRLPERILLDERVFVLSETEHDDHGPVAYYREELIDLGLPVLYDGEEFEVVTDLVDGEVVAQSARVVTINADSEEITIARSRGILRDEITRRIVTLAEDLAEAGVHPDAASAARALRRDLLG
jgi:hypothetical protein